MSTSPAAVVDSGLAIFTVVSTPQSETAARVFTHLLHERINLYAPFLWRYEVISVIHKYLVDGLLDFEEAEEAIETMFSLAVNFVEEDDDLCRSAFRWASRLRQRAAYDGFYLALAEKLGAPFWTADRRLANNAQQFGADWVHWMGEMNPSTESRQPK